MYREDGKELDVWLEPYGWSLYNYSGVTQAFEQWTRPVKETIPEPHRLLIQSRIHEWATSQRLRLEFVRGLTRAECLAQMEQDGWHPKLMPDGTELWHPPPRVTLLKKLWQRIRGVPKG